MSGPVLDQLNLVVADMERSVAFYRTLGLEIPDLPPDWQPHHRSAESPGSGLHLDLDSEAFAAQWNTGLAGLAAPHQAGPVAPHQAGSTAPGRVVIGFRFPTREAVDEAYDRLTAAGHSGQQPPYDAFWGARYAVVEDPDGNPVGLMSPATAEHRRPQAPPQSAG